MRKRTYETLESVEWKAACIMYNYIYISTQHGNYMQIETFRLTFTANVKPLLASEVFDLKYVKLIKLVVFSNELRKQINH